MLFPAVPTKRGRGARPYLAITSLATSLAVIALTLALAAVAPASAQVVDGLLMHLPFNGDASDVSGHGCHGQVYGPVLVPDRVGNPDAAYAFDGVDDYIRIANQAPFQLTSWTIAVWVYLPAGGAGSCSLVHKESVAERYNFWLGLDDDPQIFMSAYETCDSEFDHEVYAGVPARDEWCHVVSTRDEATGMSTIYVNGIWESQGEWQDTACANISSVEIGTPGAYGTLYFEGVIDDVRIYDRALDEIEVEELYNEQVPVESSSWTAVKAIYRR